jgi:hypothetical protein
VRLKDFDTLDEILSLELAQSFRQIAPQIYELWVAIIWRLLTQSLKEKRSWLESPQADGIQENGLGYLRRARSGLTLECFHIS